MILRIIKKVYKIIKYRNLNECGNNFYVEIPFYLYGGDHIRIGNNFSATSGVRIEAWDRFENYHYMPTIEIGDNVSINYHSHIGAAGKIKIGNGVLIGSNVLIIDHNHGELKTKKELEVLPAKRKLHIRGDIYIDDNVWIGENVCILGGVHIGRGAVIGANSVVTKSVEAYTVAAGNPAKVIRKINR